MPAAISPKKRMETKTISSLFTIFTTRRPHRKKIQDQNRFFLRRPYHHFPRTLLSLSLLFFLMLRHGRVVQAEAVENIKVTESGVRPLKPGDTAMVFYANVSHTGKLGDFPIAARLQMEKCCMQVNTSHTPNCEAMKLISGLVVVLRPNVTQTLQMYFVNHDLHDREGSCVLHMLYKRIERDRHKGASSAVDDISSSHWQTGEQITIPFNTVLPRPNLLQKLISGSSNGYRICNSDNYNALRECSNYDDCLIRYAGDRSMYSKSVQGCEATPTCSEGETHFLSVVTRQCEKSHDIGHVQRSFPHSMVYVDSLGSPSSGDQHSSHLSDMLNRRTVGVQRPQNLVCEHGHHVTGKNGRPNCTCHDGWRSLTMKEWRDKGGVVDNSPHESLFYHKMCTVPLMEQKTRGYIILAFLAICVIIPFIVMLIHNHSKKKEETEKKKSDSLLEGGASSSSSSTEDDDDKDDEESALKCKQQSCCKPLPVEMEDEEANKVISEITNRREPLPSKQPSKNKDNDDDDGSGGAPPPPPSPAVSNVTSKSSKQQQQKSGTSKSNWSIPWSAKGGEPTQMPTPPSQKSRSKQSMQPKAPPSSKPSTGGVFTNSKHTQMKYYTPSQGFDYEDNNSEEEDERGTMTSEVNLNNLICRVLTQTPSTDDLLGLNKHEKSEAHLPMKPKTGKDKGVSVVMANCATVELKDNDVILHSVSSEEITQRKKDEWAQFIESVSRENVNVRTGPRPYSVKGIHRIEEEDEDEEKELDMYTRTRRGMLADFQYFNNDVKPKALKVRSVPGMMQYHPFSSIPTAPNVMFSDERREENRNDVSVEPPPVFIQKAFGSMCAEEQAERQECYRVLSSLSNERILASEKEGNLPGKNSIWSNIASENTKEVSVTPNTTTAEGSRVASSIEQSEVVNLDEDEMTLRTKTIYGEMGSDIDSDGALEEIAQWPSPQPSTSRQTSQLRHQQRCPGDRQIKREFGSRESEEANNRTVYGSHPVAPPPTTVPPTEASRDTRNENANDPNFNDLINLNVLESDFIPIEAYLSSNSAESSRIASRSESFTTEFWKIIANLSLGGQAKEIGPTSSDASVRGEPMDPETDSAYRIKSSLEVALKASRSRSGTNLFSS